MTGFQLPHDLSKLLESKPETSSEPVGAHTCGGCDSTWSLSAKAACHCSACHRTFSGIGLFDRHRRHQDVEGDRGTCLDPATMFTKSGEPLAEFRNGMWRGPEAPEGTWDQFKKPAEPEIEVVIDNNMPDGMAFIGPKAVLR